MGAVDVAAHLAAGRPGLMFMSPSVFTPGRPSGTNEGGGGSVTRSGMPVVGIGFGVGILAIAILPQAPA
jgi:hypothetical protein